MRHRSGQVHSLAQVVLSTVDLGDAIRAGMSLPMATFDSLARRRPPRPGLRRPDTAGMVIPRRSRGRTWTARTRLTPGPSPSGGGPSSPCSRRAYLSGAGLLARRRSLPGPLEPTVMYGEVGAGKGFVSLGF